MRRSGGPRLRPLALAAWACAMTAACAAPPQGHTNHQDKDKTMSTDRPTRSSSRIRAPEVPAVEHAGVRYEQVKAPSSEGLPPGGYVAATEAATGKRRWTARVYETQVDPRREADVQMVFFRSLALAEEGKALVVEDERGRRFRVSTADGAVSAVP